MKRPLVLGAGFLLVILGLAGFLPALWQLPLSRAESMYALIPQEMLHSGSWLTPTLNGVKYLDKPPLLYWYTLVIYQVFGAAPWVARVPTMLLFLGEIWLTYLIGLRLVGARAAWLGAFILLTSIGFYSLHLQILTDHLITLSLLAAVYFLLRWQEQPSWRWPALFQLALAAGFLTKGFIGLVFPLAIGILFTWGRTQDPRPRAFCRPRNLALLLLFTVPAYWAMEWANPGFLWFNIINEQVMRFLGQRQPPDINPFSIPGFWLFLGLWLMPWTFLLPEALYRYWRETRSPAGEEGSPGRVLLIWPIVILGFFTLSSSRIEYYSLPALPPLALILGWRLECYLQAQRDRSLIWSLVLLALLGLATLVLLPLLEGLCVANRREFIGLFTCVGPMARQVTLWVPLLSLLGLALAPRFPRATLACWGGLALMLVYFTFQTMVAISPLISDQAAGDYLRRTTGPEDLVVMESIEEFEYGASLSYYSGRQILMVQRNGWPQFPCPVPPEQNYLISPNRLQELWHGGKRVFLLVDDITVPEPFLEAAPEVLASLGKRLLVNRQSVVPEVACPPGESSKSKVQSSRFKNQ